MEPKMRRKDRAISNLEAKKLLREGRYGVLSTTSPDGKPYGVPISYTYRGNAIYFHGATEGRKITNLQSNNKVSFCVVGRTRLLPSKFATNYESVIVSGRVLELTGEKKRQALIYLLKKYSPAHIEKGLQYIQDIQANAKVFKIAIQTVTGKARKK